MEDEILQEFLAESWENLGRLDTEIVQLEREPSNLNLLGSIFRTIHTIKGTCGFIGLSRLGLVAHATENVLGRMRDGRLEVSPPAVSLVLDGIDRIKELLAGLEEGGQEPNLNSNELIHRLDLLASLGDPIPKVSAEPEMELVEPEATPEPVAAPVEPMASKPEQSDRTPAPLTGMTEISVLEPAPVMAEPVVAAVRTAADTNESPEAGADGRKSVADLSIRVNVDVLDLLMNLVGELVLTRNQLLQLVRGEEESRFSAPISLLNRVTTDLQEGVMKTRMQPIGNAWSKLPRLVRDLCRLTSKMVELEMLGAETELDRTVLDAIKDPLTHMVRNSVDHGIESPAVRRQMGKTEHGTLRLRAYHEGGHVIICVEDDGKGIDAQRVLRKALDQGLITEVEAASMSDSEIQKLIFRPGFSTAEQITSVSGRGVGMDVVRTEIERIGGTVELNSIFGQGTTIRIKIPLTLAIISALVVESGSIHFAIPQLGVVELVRVPAEERKRIERIHDQQVFRLRNRLLPLIELREVLGLEASTQDDDVDLYIVVVQVGEEQLGLIVSEVFDTQEIVVKPVGRLLKDINVYQGTTILGDGRVIMILDVAGIAGRYSNNSNQTTTAANAGRNESEDQIEPTSLLVVSTEDDRLLAVPLSLVSRLEEFPRTSIEWSGDRMLVQYRGHLLPLVNLADSRSRGPLRDLQPVVVFSDGSNALGLIVDQIKDILEEPLIIRNGTKRSGTLGTAVIDGKATDVIDTQHYLKMTNPNWFRREAQASVRRLLVVVESLFFRQLVRTACEAAGFRVTIAETVTRAEEMLEHGDVFDAILCDADGQDPRLTQLSDWARKGSGGEERPIVVLTGAEFSEFHDSLRACGADVVLPKFDPQELTTSLKDLWHQRARSKGVLS
ncbi:chemotaxis protein CheA [bacterium]|nr:chemotaxis protein CheA [bacterium]